MKFRVFDTLGRYMGTSKTAEEAFKRARHVAERYGGAATIKNVGTGRVKQVWPDGRVRTL